MLRQSSRLAGGVAQAALIFLAAASTVHAAETADAGGEGGAVKEITVTGQAKKSAVARVVSAGALGSASVLETPFSIEAVTSDEIRGLQTKDLNGVFRDDASITEVNSSVAAASGAAFRIRGVVLDQLNSFKVDGLAIPYWSIDLPIEQFDQVQLLKGATGFMYGFGSPAGVVNFITKRPTDAPLLSADFGYRSDSLYSGHVDASTRLVDGRVGLRVNLQGEDGGVYNGGHNSNYSGAVAADVKLTDKLTWTGDAFYMRTRQTDEVNTVSVGSAVTHLTPVSGDTNFGAVGDWKTNEMNIFTTGLNYDFNSNWKATLSYRHTKLDENYPGNLITISDNKGDYSSTAFFVQRMFEIEQIQSVVEGHFDTGPLTHDLVFGAGVETQHYYSDAGALATYPIGSGNIYSNPQPTLAAHPASLYNPKLYQLNEYTQQSLFAGDTIGWGKWSLLAGFRYTTYKDTVRGPTNAVTAIYKANPLSPTIALSYEILPRTRAYVSYVQGLQNGGAAGAANLNNGATFGPIHTQQYEAGLKTDQRIWNGTLALFRLDQGADYVNTSNVYVQSGQVRYQGVEANAAVRPTPDWTLSASATYLDAALRDEGPVYTGKEVPGVAKVQATVRAAYQIPLVPGLGVDLNVKYTGDGYGDTVNHLEFPSHETEDLGVSYTTAIDTHRVTFRGAVKNLADQRYWIYNSSTVLPGEPRTFMFSIHGDF